MCGRVKVQWLPGCDAGQQCRAIPASQASPSPAGDPHTELLPCGVSFPRAICVLLSVFPSAAYLRGCCEMLRSSYSFTNPFIFLARHENAEPELWNEPSHLQWVESRADPRQQERENSASLCSPALCLEHIQTPHQDSLE